MIQKEVPTRTRKQLTLILKFICFYCLVFQLWPLKMIMTSYYDRWKWSGKKWEWVVKVRRHVFFSPSVFTDLGWCGCLLTKAQVYVDKVYADVSNTSYQRHHSWPVLDHSYPMLGDTHFLSHSQLNDKYGDSRTVDIGPNMTIYFRVVTQALRVSLNFLMFFF